MRRRPVRLQPRPAAPLPSPLGGAASSCDYQDPYIPSASVASQPPGLTADTAQRSADTATGVLEHAADGYHSSGATSAAVTDDDNHYDDVPQSDDGDDADRRSGGDVSNEPSVSCSVTSEDEPLLDCADYRKIRDLNRRVREATRIVLPALFVRGTRDELRLNVLHAVLGWPQHVAYAQAACMLS